MKKGYIFFCLLLGWSHAGKSQPANATTDSMTQRLALAPADTNRVRLLEQLARAVVNDNGAQALRYGQEGLLLARQLHDRYGEALLLNRLGTSYFQQADMVNAARCYQHALRRATAVPWAHLLQAKALVGLGRVATIQMDFLEAQRYFQQALQQQQRYRAGPEELGVTHNNLGMFYFGWLKSGRPHPDSVPRLCLYHTRLALTTLRARFPKANLAVYLNSLGQVHAFNKQYDSAYYYHRTALRIYQRLGQARGIAIARTLLGTALLAQNRFAGALAMARPALVTARQLKSSALIANDLEIMSDALAGLGRGNEAFRLAREGHNLRDSLAQLERAANLTQLRVQFDTELERGRVRELTSLNRLQALQARKQRQYLWGLGSFLLVVVVSLVISSVLTRRLRRQRTELEATRAEQDRLYALIAHDLRSPVMAFSGLADLLTAYSERQDTVRLLRLGGRVRQAAENLRALLDNLLNWALSQRGELRPAPEPLQVMDLLMEITSLYQPSAQTAGITLMVPPAAGEQLVLADRNMTLTVLRNLVNNALQATPTGGQITVSIAETDTAWLRLTVADTGLGMSAPDLHRVMSDQLQLSAGQHRARAGLGLRLSRLFAHLQGGWLDLSSTPGQGTTATLVLPRPAPEGTADA